MAIKKTAKSPAKKAPGRAPTPEAHLQAMVLLGSHLRSHREAAGITQAEIATALDMDRAYYGLIERGTVIPSAIAMLRIAHQIGISLDEVAPTDKAFWKLIAG